MRRGDKFPKYSIMSLSTKVAYTPSTMSFHWHLCPFTDYHCAADWETVQSHDASCIGCCHAWDVPWNFVDSRDGWRQRAAWHAINSISTAAGVMCGGQGLQESHTLQAANGNRGGGKQWEVSCEMGLNMHRASPAHRRAEQSGADRVAAARPGVHVETVEHRESSTPPYKLHISLQVSPTSHRHQSPEERLRPLQRSQCSQCSSSDTCNELYHSRPAAQGPPCHA